MDKPILIIGAGQAGMQIADSLRQEGYEGRVLMIGEEAYPPYQRPPLSKDFLAGTVTQEQLLLRAPDVLERKKIELHTHARVVKIDASAQRVELSDGTQLDYAKLALTTGCRARPLPVAGADLQNVLTLRTLDDTKTLAAALAQAQNIVVIGGGFIGLELAATARGMGKQVTLLEGADRLMARAVSPIISSYFRDYHQAQGVRIILQAQVQEISGEAGKANGVTTKDGHSYPADLVIVGIGIVPNSELAQDIGLECHNGIIVDVYSRTSNSDIVAAGDCTVRKGSAPDQWLRLESVQNAVEQGKSAAASLLGRERAFTAAPWFWSDQYEVKLQMAGLSAGYDQTALRGTIESGSFSVFYFRDGKLLGADSVNQPKEHMATRRMLDKGVSPSPEQVQDLSFNFQTLLK